MLGHMPPDERPGDRATTLDELYDLVPQAEEIDLRDELERETRREHWLEELRPLLGSEPDPSQDDQRPTVSDPQPEPWRLTDSQVVGMLEHLLGAEHVDDGADWD